MRRIVCYCLAVATSMATFAASVPDDAKTIQGTWLPIKAELGGQPMTAAVLKSISLKIADGKYEVLVGDQSDKGTYTLDATTTPKGMTITGTGGPNNGKTFPCIYELKGDMLRVSYDL